MARQHVGDEPFAVLLGDDIMHPGHPLLGQMLAAYDEHHRSVVALKPVPKADVSLYGCASVEPIDGSLVRLKAIVEKPAVADAPSDLAVMGRYVFGPEIFDVIDRVEPGRGGEIQLTDAIAMLIDDPGVHGWVFQDGRYDIGNKLDWLRASVALALEDPELGPPFRVFIEGLARGDQ